MYLEHVGASHDASVQVHLCVSPSTTTVTTVTITITTTGTLTARITPHGGYDLTQHLDGGRRRVQLPRAVVAHLHE